jgi:hypothetical protein
MKPRTTSSARRVALASRRDYYGVGYDPSTLPPRPSGRLQAPPGPPPAETQGEPSSSDDEESTPIPPPNLGNGGDSSDDDGDDDGSSNGSSDDDGSRESSTDRGSNEGSSSGTSSNGSDRDRAEGGTALVDGEVNSVPLGVLEGNVAFEIPFRDKLLSFGLTELQANYVVLNGATSPNAFARLFTTSALDALFKKEKLNSLMILVVERVKMFHRWLNDQYGAGWRATDRHVPGRFH